MYIFDVFLTHIYDPISGNVTTPVNVMLTCFISTLYIFVEQSRAWMLVDHTKRGPVEPVWVANTRVVSNPVVADR